MTVKHTKTQGGLKKPHEKTWLRHDPNNVLLVSEMKRLRI